ncbi:hydroxyquinol 1,2-dioxygenase [Marinobacter sp. 71-i]|uniref:Hydroxyquinol 1,2-dioxygenase n=1 Tax=Marinobacter iranensis TaxID=2962607 RepID=A0ABT5YG85_9GAMM|nr:dioxygenase [Marinobacter iranensis]MDF0752584.1 hydroxyquinol 1,2-dioxygenase [Marinobacter iranensis]
MVSFDTDAHLKEVLSSFDQCEDQRFKEIMRSVVYHLHACVSELKLSPEEWEAAIRFLTETGQICTSKRQEFILLSDLLGVSTLTIGLNQHRGDHCLEETVEGPFYWEGAPEMALGSDISQGAVGEKAYYFGRVLNSADEPLANALLDVWSGDGEGHYDMQSPDEDRMQARAKIRTDSEGRYSFWSIKPNYYPIPTDGPAGKMQAKSGRHPNRPGHVHFKISTPGYHSVNTQIFVAGGPYLDTDCVFGVKRSLIVDFTRHPAGSAPDGSYQDAPYYTANFDFRLTEYK